MAETDISVWNWRVIQAGKKAEERDCSCRKVENCPLEGKCLHKNVIYQATVTPNQNKDQAKNYIGLTSTTFKERLGNHKFSFRHREHRKETTLSQHVWDLIGNGTPYDIHWKLVNKAKPFSPVSGICELCLVEKFYIMFRPELATINKRDEINNYCPHKISALLGNT